MVRVEHASLAGLPGLSRRWCESVVAPYNAIDMSELACPSDSDYRAHNGDGKTQQKELCGQHPFTEIRRPCLRRGASYSVR